MDKIITKLIEMRAEQQVEIQKKQIDMQIEIIKMHQNIQELIAYKLFLKERVNKINKLKSKL